MVAGQGLNQNVLDILQALVNAKISIEQGEFSTDFRKTNICGCFIFHMYVGCIEDSPERDIALECIKAVMEERFNDAQASLGGGYLEARRIDKQVALEIICSTITEVVTVIEDMRNVASICN